MSQRPGSSSGEHLATSGAVSEGARSALEELLVRYPVLADTRDEVLASFHLLMRAFEGGNKVLCCGNGGSAADASHIVGELMKGMMWRRPIPVDEAAALESLGDRELAQYLLANLEGALPAIDLGSQHSLTTAIGNDTAGDMLFAQQVEGYGRNGDLLWALSTSGRSRNVLLAAALARVKGVRVLAFTGAADSQLSRLADLTVKVPALSVQGVQELHLPIYHTLCEMLETSLFRGPPPTGEASPGALRDD